MTSECVFCKIGRGELPAAVVFQDKEIIAFRDVSPSAPTHVLIVPRQHFASAAEISDQLVPLVGRMVQIAAQIAREEKVEESGYRLVTNTGPNGGQSVGHFHLHLLGGRKMKALG